MWKNGILKYQDRYRFVEGVYTSDDITGNVNLQQMLREDGTDFYARAAVAGSQSFFDTAIVFHHLQALFQSFSAQTILDVGCGDGRMTAWFLEHTTANVVAVDCSMDSLLRLQQNYLLSNEGFSRRVLLLQANIVDIPIIDHSCDFIWAFESLYYLLDHYREGIEEACRILTASGVLANCDRDYEYGLLYELLNHGPEAMMQSHRTKLMREFCGDSCYQARLLCKAEIRQVLNASGLSVTAELPIPAVSFMVSYLHSKGLFIEDIEEHAAELSTIFIDLLSETSFVKSTIFLSKRGGQG